MILTRDEIAFLDVYCREGTEPPFGGPATDAMTSIGVHSGDTLNLQWAYLRDKPPTGPVIGSASAHGFAASTSFQNSLTGLPLSPRRAPLCVPCQGLQ